MREFGLHELKILFMDTQPQRGNLPAGYVDQFVDGETSADATPQGEGAEVAISQTEIGEQTAEEKALQEDIRLSQLMTHDPVAYEQEMIDANLTQDISDGGDS